MLAGRFASSRNRSRDSVPANSNNLEVAEVADSFSNVVASTDCVVKKVWYHNTTWVQTVSGVQARQPTYLIAA